MEKLEDLWTRQTKERRELEEKQSELKTQLLAQLKEAENELAGWRKRFCCSNRRLRSRSRRK